MSVILHIGIKATEKKRSRVRWALANEENVKIFFDGDAWEEWGEPLVMHEHVTIRIGAFLGDETDADLAADALRHAGFLQRLGLLKPMSHPEYQAGIIASITREEWSEEIMHIRQTQEA